MKTAVARSIQARKLHAAVLAANPAWQRTGVLLLALGCLGASVSVAASGPAEPRILSAFFGLDDALPPASEALCTGSAGLDGLPFVFDREILTEVAEGKSTPLVPFALGDLNDRDNVLDLCLEKSVRPLRVEVDAGTVIDPRGDANPATAVDVQSCGRWR
jgi:hypothetical protein